jgi:prolyl oligopeptidase
VGVESFTAFRPEGAFPVVNRNVTFWTAKHWSLQPDGSLKAIPLPDDARFEGIFQGQILAILRSDWKTGAKTFPAGALVSLPMSAIWDAEPASSLQLVWQPDERSSIAGVSQNKDFLYLDILQNVQGRILLASRGAAGWALEVLPLPQLGNASVRAADEFANDAYLSFESFLVPPTLYSYRPGRDIKAVKSLPARFSAKGLVAEQFEATSKDGTKVPYFLVHREGMKFDGSNPTYLYGYGGFEISMDPFYLGDVGKVWLEKGGAFALAYDDFEAVAEDLEARKVSSPRRLGIMGGSNGGLLVGTVFTQRPELFNAVVCQVPLLDMLRYTKIAAGSSWIGEYGDPADPKMAEAIARYSPYQNVKAETKYPEMFLLTSTKDDRVGPVHARKMAAKLEATGHEVLYWENIEGGHGAAADLEERVKMRSLQYTYLMRRLAD